MAPCVSDRRRSRSWPRQGHFSRASNLSPRQETSLSLSLDLTFSSSRSSRGSSASSASPESPSGTSTAEQSPDPPLPPTPTPPPPPPSTRQSTTSSATSTSITTPPITWTSLLSSTSQFTSTDTNSSPSVSLQSTSSNSEPTSSAPSSSSEAPTTTTPIQTSTSSSILQSSSISTTPSSAFSSSTSSTSTLTTSTSSQSTSSQPTSSTSSTLSQVSSTSSSISSQSTSTPPLSSSQPPPSSSQPPTSSTQSSSSNVFSSAPISSTASGTSTASSSFISSFSSLTVPSSNPATSTSTSSTVISSPVASASATLAGGSANPPGTFTKTTVSPSSSTTGATGTLVPGGQGNNRLENNPGAIAGLVVGVTAALALLALLAYYFIRRRFPHILPSPPPTSQPRVPFDEEEMTDNALGPIAHRMYGHPAPARSGDELLGSSGSDHDPDAPVSSLGHTLSLSHGGHSLMSNLVGFAPNPILPSNDEPEPRSPQSSSHGHSQAVAGGLPSSSGHGGRTSSSGHGHPSTSAHGHSSHGHDAATSSSSHGGIAWFQSDELLPPVRPGLHADSSGSGSGTGSGSGSGSTGAVSSSVNSSQPLLARSPLPPSSFTPPPGSPQSLNRRFSLPWRGSSSSGRRKSSLPRPEAPTFFESSPRPRSPPPATITLPTRPPALTRENLPFPTPDEGPQTPDGLLRTDVRRTEPMQSVGELSLRDDIDYTRPVFARMFTSTTIDTTAGRTASAPGSRHSASSGRPSVYSTSSADHTVGFPDEGPVASAARTVPPIVVENEELEVGQQSPEDIDPMLPRAS